MGVKNGKVNTPPYPSLFLPTRSIGFIARALCRGNRTLVIA